MNGLLLEFGCAHWEFLFQSASLFAAGTTFGSGIISAHPSSETGTPRPRTLPGGRTPVITPPAISSALADRSLVRSSADWPELGMAFIPRYGATVYGADYPISRREHRGIMSC